MESNVKTLKFCTFSSATYCAAIAMFWFQFLQKVWIKDTPNSTALRCLKQRLHLDLQRTAVCYNNEFISGGLGKTSSAKCDADSFLSLNWISVESYTVVHSNQAASVEENTKITRTDSLLSVTRSISDAILAEWKKSPFSAQFSRQRLATLPFRNVKFFMKWSQPYWQRLIPAGLLPFVCLCAVFLQLENAWQCLALG